MVMSVFPAALISHRSSIPVVFQQIKQNTEILLRLRQSSACSNALGSDEFVECISICTVAAVAVSDRHSCCRIGLHFNYLIDQCFFFSVSFYHSVVISMHIHMNSD